MRTSGPLRWALTALAVLGLATTGCGPKLDSDGSGLDVPPADTEASGSVAVSGSSTVEPISALVAEEFMAQNGDVAITVDGPGTGDGFELFCAGDVDVADASRPIKAEEVRACEAAGIDFIELPVGVDGLSVVTSASNPIACLNMLDLYALTGPESEGIETWDEAEVLARELGSDTDLPSSHLIVTAPGPESGTFDSFVELVLDPITEQRVEAGVLDEALVGTARADYAAQPDDNAILTTVAADPGGLAWAGFAFVDQAEDVHPVPIAVEPGDECVAPTVDTIQDGTYPIGRTLFIYVNAAEAERNDGLRAFVNFYLGGLDTFVTTSDYVPLADPDLTRQRWEQRTTGSAET